MPIIKGEDNLAPIMRLKQINALPCRISAVLLASTVAVERQKVDLLENVVRVEKFMLFRSPEYTPVGRFRMILAVISLSLWFDQSG